MRRIEFQLRPYAVQVATSAQDSTYNVVVDVLDGLISSHEAMRGGSSSKWPFSTFVEPLACTSPYTSPCVSSLHSPSFEVYAKLHKGVSSR